VEFFVMWAFIFHVAELMAVGASIEVRVVGGSAEDVGVSKWGASDGVEEICVRDAVGQEKAREAGMVDAFGKGDMFGTHCGAAGVDMCKNSFLGLCRGCKWAGYVDQKDFLFVFAG